VRLYLDRFGLEIRKEEERLILRWEGGEEEAELHSLEGVIVAQGGDISFGALSILARRGIPLDVIGWRGEHLGTWAGPEDGRLARRLAQGRVFQNQEACLPWARGVLLAKSRGQAALLKSAWKSRGWGPPPQLPPLGKEATSIPLLMGWEGACSAAYWSHFRRLVPEEWGFVDRSGRGAQDPFNALLNFLYGVLRVQVHRSVRLAGLEPELGFLHAERPGKPSLVLDLMEPFRPVLADRAARRLVARKEVTPLMFTSDGEGLRLTEEARKASARMALEMLDQVDPATGLTFGRHMDQQAERAAVSLLAGGAGFEPFVWGL
jgi:CRISP-associated protein Cas1